MQFSEKLKNTVGKKLDKKLRLMIFTESARSLLYLPQICRIGIELSRNSPFILDGVVFGSDDFCANIGKIFLNINKFNILLIYSVNVLDNYKF